MGKLADISAALDTAASGVKTDVAMVAEAREDGIISDAAKAAAKAVIPLVEAAGMGEPTTASVNDGVVRLVWSTATSEAMFKASPVTDGGVCTVAMAATFSSHAEAATALKAMKDASGK